jgi:4-hydroxy-3-polyprenylbenzoate decarboxylase
MQRHVVVAVTGASGMAYAVRLVEVLCEAGCDVHLSISANAVAVLRQELGLTVDLERFSPGMLGLEPRRGSLRHHHYADFMAPIASGSFLTDGMVICPCSLGTLSAIVHGTTTNLIHRAAEVHLKERRTLILVPRETPLSLVQLDSLRRAAEAGAVILPAMPGFYHGAKTIQDLVDFVVARICDQLGVPNELIQRWGNGGRFE